MAYDPAELVGILTGNPAARAKAAAGAALALNKVDQALKDKASALGQKLGNKLGAPIFDALAKGADAGQTAAVDTAARETTGYTITQVKSALTRGGVWLGLVAVVVAYLVFKRRK